MTSYKILIKGAHPNCFPNLIDCARLYNYLIKNNHFVTDNVSDADYVIINSCGFINELQDKCIKLFQNYNNIKKKNAKIIMYGCLVNINKDLLNNFDLIQIGINENNKLDKIFYNTTNFEIIKPYCNNELSKKLLKDKKEFTIWNTLPFFLTKMLIPFSKKLKIKYNHLINEISFKNRYFVQISKGCTEQCSYCTVKKSKGKLLSRNKNDIISDINKIYDPLKPLFLVADDCASFGVDLDLNLIDLLYEINEKYPDLEINLNYINPAYLEKDYVRYIELFSKINVGLLIFPIQSGSQNIIRKMNRKYNVEKVLKIVDQIKIVSPNTIFYTLFIIGFPGESTLDFIKTLLACRHFDYPVAFKYSDIKGTSSSKLLYKKSKFVVLIRWIIFIIFINYIIYYNVKRRDISKNY